MTNEKTHKNDKERRERNSNKKYNKEQQSNNKKKIQNPFTVYILFLLQIH